MTDFDRKALILFAGTVGLAFVAYADITGRSASRLLIRAILALRYRRASKPAPRG